MMTIFLKRAINKLMLGVLRNLAWLRSYPLNLKQLKLTKESVNLIEL